MPLFNQEAYIRQCVESCLAQTYKNFTLTIVNDGSTDCSRRVLQEVIDDWMREDNLKREPCMKEIEQTGIFNEKERQKIWSSIFTEPDLKMTDDGSTFTREQNRRRCTFLSEVTRLGFDDENKWKIKDKYYPDGERVAPTVIDQENRGLSESRNTAIRAVSGCSFILPLDADDWIEPTYLEKTVPLMSNPEVGIVATSMKYEGLLHNVIAPMGLTLQHQMQTNDLPVCSLYRRECYNQTRGYETLFVEVGGSTRVLGYEDYEFWISVLKRGWKVATVLEPLFHYTVRPNSMISQAKTKHADA